MKKVNKKYIILLWACSIFITTSPVSVQNQNEKTFSLGLHLSHYKFTDEEKIDLVHLANQLGSNIVRYEVNLHEIDTGILDQIIANVHKNTEILITLSHSRFMQPHFPSHIPGDISSYLPTVEQLLQQYGSSSSDISLKLYSPCDQHYCTQMLDALVRKYKNRVKYWQIENEVYGAPNQYWIGSKEDYVKVMNDAYDVIKSVDPSLKVVLAGIAIGTMDKIPDIPESNFLGYTLRQAAFDIVDLHLYYRYQLIPDRLNSLKHQLHKLGLENKPIWVTELGGVDPRSYGLNIWKKENTPPLPMSEKEELRQQAEEVIKRFTLCFCNGAEKIFWHKPIDNLKNAFWSHMALCIKDSTHTTKRPAFYTYRLLTDKIKGFSSVEKISDTIYRFRVNNNDVYVLWSDSGEKYIDLSNRISSEKIRIEYIVTELDGTGAPIYIPNTEAPTRTIKIGQTPIFVSENNI